LELNVSRSMYGISVQHDLHRAGGWVHQLEA
jgi:hypothetical protein